MRSLYQPNTELSLYWPLAYVDEYVTYHIHSHMHAISQVVISTFAISRGFGPWVEH